MNRETEQESCPGGPPRLPSDAERLGLTSLTAPGAQVAASLASGRFRNPVLAWIALVIVAIPVLMVLALIVAKI